MNPSPGARRLARNLVAALLVPLGIAGCVIADHADEPTPGIPGNVDFLWQFTDGNSCASLAGAVARMQVTIPGQALQNSGAFPCDVGGTDGIELQDFAPGPYNYTVEALDVNDNALYTASGSFVVDGDVEVQVALTPTSPAFAAGDVSFFWQFPDGICASLPQIASIQVSIPGQTLQNAGQYPCDVGGVDGIQLDDFAGGTYSYSVDALDSFGNVLYEGQGQFTVNGDTQVDVVFDATSPTASASLNLIYGFAGSSCGAAQVQAISVGITDSSGNELNPAADQAYLCSDGSTLSWNGLPSETVNLQVSGYDGNNDLLWGALQGVFLQAGVVNTVQVNLVPCGTVGAGC